MPLGIGEVERKRYPVIKHHLDRKTLIDDMLVKSAQVRQRTHFKGDVLQCRICKKRQVQRSLFPMAAQKDIRAQSSRVGRDYIQTKHIMVEASQHSRILSAKTDVADAN